MNVYKKIGTKERLIEMFEKVNKIKINESAMWGEKVNNENFDSPIKKDKKYLDKTVGDQTSQVSKYDDGTRYPVEDELKVKDPSLEKLKGDDAPITEDFSDAPEFKAQAQLTTSNFGGMEIEVDDSGDGLRYRWNQSDSPDEPVEAEIEYDTDGEPYFKTAEGESYFLSDFMRVNYPQMNEVEDDQDIANQDEPVNVGDVEPEDNDGGADEKPAWDEDFGGNDEPEGTEVEDPEMSIDDIPAGDGEEAPELDNEIEDGGVEQMTNTMEEPHEDQIEGGLADTASPSDFCPIQIGKGIQIEMEHTNDPHKALEISMDHLTEIPDYYDRLEAMEAEAKGEGVESDEGAPEDSLLDPSKHWVDDYAAQNVSMGDDVDEAHPLEGGDPEVGEEEHEFAEKAKKENPKADQELPADPSKLITNPNIDDFSKLAGY